MKKNRFDIKFLIISIFLLNFQTIVFSEIMLLTECKNLKDSFIKNEYILDFEKSLMTRNYIYDNKTYKKHKITDLISNQEVEIGNQENKQNELINILLRNGYIDESYNYDYNILIYAFSKYPTCLFFLTLSASNIA